jgi:hypothetical protein
MIKVAERTGFLLARSTELAGVRDLGKKDGDYRAKLSVLPCEWLMYVVVNAAPENTALRGLIAKIAHRYADINAKRVLVFPVENREEFTLAALGYQAIERQALALNRQHEAVQQVAEC